jgi:hypothetical protein
VSRSRTVTTREIFAAIFAREPRGTVPDTWPSHLSALNDVWAELPEKAVQATHLHYFGGMDLVAIAEELDLDDPYFVIKQAVMKLLGVFSPLHGMGAASVVVHAFLTEHRGLTLDDLPSHIDALLTFHGDSNVRMTSRMYRELDAWWQKRHDGQSLDESVKTRSAKKIAFRR